MPKESSLRVSRSGSYVVKSAESRPTKVAASSTVDQVLRLAATSALQMPS